VTTGYRTGFPDSGDLIHLDFAPSAGKEMTGHHYALVLTTREFAKITGTLLACPITSRVRGWDFEVPLPEGLLPPKKDVGDVQSVVLTNALRQLDFRERGATIIGKAPPAVLAEVRDLLAEVLGIPLSEAPEDA
jgi:mRNA interferase MazF